MSICKLENIRKRLEYYAEKASLHGFSTDEIRTVMRGTVECVREGQMSRLGHRGGSPLLKIIWAQHNLMRVLKDTDGLIEIKD